MSEQVEDLEARREGSGYLFQKSVGGKSLKPVWIDKFSFGEAEFLQRWEASADRCESGCEWSGDEKGAVW